VTHIIYEPDQADNKQTEAIEPKHQAIWSLGILHGVLLELLGLLDEEAQDEEDRREYEPNAETGSPDGVVVFVVTSRGDHIGDEGANHKTLVFVSSLDACFGISLRLNAQ